MGKAIAEEKDEQKKHLRNYKNFNPSNPSLAKAIHPIDNESA